MRLIACVHRRGLRWPVCRVLQDPERCFSRLPENTTVITFARVKSAPVHKLTAVERFLDITTANIVCSHWDFSPLAAQLLWDTAHLIPVGGCLYLLESEGVGELLSRSYYKNRFVEITSAIPDIRCFQKKSLLPAENDRGLDAWSFCIPVGGTDADMLNACVERILSLGVEQQEIILCGQVPEDFSYFSEVKIIGKALPEYPIHITKKKNMLVKAATLPNLCILHDRVLLPVNFKDAIKRFGDNYPFVGFQSFWFADQWQATPRRYSDFGTISSVPEALIKAERLRRTEIKEFNPMKMAAQHPVRSHFGHDYLTGSLYLCKRSVWHCLPQNENLFWGEFEDVEQGIQAAVAGIPSRVNPYSLTESQRYRSIMHGYGVLSGVVKNGSIRQERSPMEWWGFTRKPALDITHQEGIKRLAAFAQRYTGSDILVRQIQHRPLTGVRRFCLIAKLLWQTQGNTKHLVEDWFKEVLCESYDPVSRESFQFVLNSAASVADKKLFFLKHISLTRQLFNNFFSSPFIMPDKTQEKTGINKFIGTFIAAVWLKFFSRHTAFPISLLQLWRILRNHRGVV